MVDRNGNYSPAAAVTLGAGEAGGERATMRQRSRPPILTDSLSRPTAAANHLIPPIEIHAPADSDPPEPVASSCGCMTDLSHHQYHHHHHPPTPHYHGNSDVNDSDADEVMGDAAPNDLLSLGQSVATTQTQHDPHHT